MLSFFNKNMPFYLVPREMREQEVREVACIQMSKPVFFLLFSANRKRQKEERKQGQQKTKKAPG